MDSQQLLLKSISTMSTLGQKLRSPNLNIDEIVSLGEKLLQELRINDLSPHQYYELNLKALEELRVLKDVFEDMERKNKTKFVDLYQRVQYAQAVVPRMYLMCTVGGAYASMDGAPAKDVLRDMLEMCKSVQHPTRGLFLRNYLNALTKDKLKLLGGSRERAEFLLQNFGEMARLWVRMQPHKGRTADASEDGPNPEKELKEAEDRSKREAERRQLRQLVGANLVRLSEECEDLDTYTTLVLPRALEVVVSCSDGYSQTYLLEVLCRVMPSEFQIETLETFLTTTCGPEVKPDVDFKQIFTTLMDHLVDIVAAATKSMPSMGNASGVVVSATSAARVFDTLAEYVGKCTNAPFLDRLAINVALLKFQMRVDAKRLDRVDAVLDSTCALLDSIQHLKMSPEEETTIVDLLRTPLEDSMTGGDVLGVLQLSKFPRLTGFLNLTNRKFVAKKLLKAVVDSPDRIQSIAIVGKLFEFLAPVVVDDVDMAASKLAEESDTDILLARLVHKLHHEDPNDLFKLLCIAKLNFSRSKNPEKASRTMTSVCYRLMDLTRKTGLKDKREVLKNVHSACSHLAGMEPNVPLVRDGAARTFLYAALAADKIGEETAAYECVVQAFTIHEEQADSKLQSALVPFMVGAVQTFSNFSKDNLETLQAKTALYAAQLLKKADQCRNVALSAHLFWSVTPLRILREGESPPIPGRNGKRTLECLQRSLKIADAVLTLSTSGNKTQALTLFVEILNQYIFFVGAGADKVKSQDITGLLAILQEQLVTKRDEELIVDPAVKAYYKRTLLHLKKRAEREPKKFGEFAMDSIKIASNLSAPLSSADVSGVEDL